MISKILFYTLVIIVFGTLLTCGFLFSNTNTYIFWGLEITGVLAILLFFILYRKLVKPYQVISNGMELLKEQDFSTRLRPIANSEANKLIEIFNRMMDQLKDERLQVREKNQFLDLLIKASPQGVIILDFDEKITEINPAGLKLLNILNSDSVIGKKPEETDIPMVQQLAGLKADDDITVRSSGITMYRCIRSSFIDRGFSHPFILIEELTHELLKIEKKSYENIIRMMAHEVNNSVGAISSTLNVISDILKQNENNELIDVLPAVEASFDRCRHLGYFISNFAEVVKIPEPSMSFVSMNELARSVDSLSRAECTSRNINLTLNLTDKNDIIHADGIQLEQVLVNIVKNSYEAIGANGNITIITLETPKTIIIEDSGPGISDELKQKLFTPFFSTKPTGQGIGLMFVKEVLINHKCKFDLYSREGKTRFEICFDSFNA